MSDLAPEAPPKPSGGIEAALKRKVIGPLPLWLLLGIGAGALLLLLRHRGAGGSSTPTPAADAGSGALDAATASPSGDPGAGVGSTSGGPTGNLGGFEDPGVGGPSFDPGFAWPDGSAGVSPSPPPSDPVYDPSAGMIPMEGGWYSPGWENPDVQQQLALLGRTYARTHPGWGSNTSKPSPFTPSPLGSRSGGFELVGLGGGGGADGWVQVGGGRSLAALVSPYSSSAGRIAAATTPYSVSPSGMTTVHVSSAAEAPLPAAQPGRAIAI